MSDRDLDRQADSDRKYAMLQWLNRNRRQLLSSDKNQYVAYNANGSIAHGENLQEVLEKANSHQADYLIYLVPKKTSSIQILPIYFRSVARSKYLVLHPIITILNKRDRFLGAYSIFKFN